MWTHLRILINECSAGPGGGFDSASGDYDYYSADGINFSNEDEEAFFRNEAADPDFGANLAKAFSEIYGNPDLNFMAFGYGGMSVQIYCDSLPDTFDSQEQQVLLSERFNSPAMDGREVCEFMNLYQFDYPVETHFNFRVSEGQLLTEIRPGLKCLRWKKSCVRYLPKTESIRLQFQEVLTACVFLKQNPGKPCGSCWEPAL